MGNDNSIPSYIKYFKPLCAKSVEEPRRNFSFERGVGTSRDAGYIWRQSEHHRSPAEKSTTRQYGSAMASLGAVFSFGKVSQGVLSSEAGESVQRARSDF